MRLGPGREDRGDAAGDVVGVAYVDLKGAAVKHPKKAIKIRHTSQSPRQLGRGRTGLARHQAEAAGT